MKRTLKALFPFLLLAGLAVLVATAGAATYTFTGSFTVLSENTIETVPLTAGVKTTLSCSENTIPGDGLGHVHTTVSDPNGVILDTLCCWDGKLTFTPTITGTYSFNMWNYYDAPVTYKIAVNAGEAAPAPVPAVPVPGCDVGLKLTSDAVVGAFVANTTPLWGPAEDETTSVTIPAGKTAWVLGVDASGQYYKFYWQCETLWAPVGAIGPNYDAVWNGKPLPSVVVK